MTYIAPKKPLTDSTPCIVDIDRLWVWNFYDTIGLAKGQLPEVQAKNPDSTYEIMRLDEFERREKEKYLAPARQITKEQWWDALEVLPPEDWRPHSSPETFRMCEYYTGSMTNQYGSYNSIFIQKMIDVRDKSTWITVKDFEPFKPLPEGAEE